MTTKKYCSDSQHRHNHTVTTHFTRYRPALQNKERHYGKRHCALVLMND